MNSSYLTYYATCSLESDLGAPLPAMLFSKNGVCILHVDSGMFIHFDPLNAIRVADPPAKQTDTTGVKVAEAEEWCKAA